MISNWDFGTCPTMKVFETSKLHFKFLFYVFILSLHFFGVILASSDVILEENIALARCRTTCLQKFTSRFTGQDDECSRNSDCDMCWNSCRMFQGNLPAKSTLCRDHTACFPGCQLACKFYEESSPKNLTPPLTGPRAPLPALMAPPKLVKEGRLVWEPPRWLKGSSQPSPGDAVLYIVMIKKQGYWKQHIQTSLTRAVVPNSVHISEIRLLAVTSSGLVAFADPSLESPTEADGKGASDSAVPETPRDEGVDEAMINESAFEAEERHKYDREAADQQPPSVPIDHSWEVNLDLLSVDLLASVKVSWEFRGSDQVDYMVTWTESTGGISGHMVTKQDQVEISLWSGQHYSIQVELLDQHGNSVLRSVPKTISFRSPDNSESETTVAVPKRVTMTTTTPVPRSASFTDFTYSTFVYPSVIQKKEISPHVNDAIEERDFKLGNPRRRTTHPDVTTAKSSLNSSFPRWKNEEAYNRVTLTNSRKEGTLLDPSQSESTASSPLMTWAVCLSVGAVVILMLIIWAVRTLRKSAVARQEIGRNDDYLSETTASSVNSSSITTCSQLSRSSRGVHDTEDPPWAYETFYRINNPALNTKVYQRPPPPIHAPPSPPVHSTPSALAMTRHIAIPLCTHANAVHLQQTPLTVNPSLVNTLTNHNCYGNL